MNTVQMIGVGVICGFVGAVAGMVILAMCIVARRADKHLGQ